MKKIFLILVVISPMIFFFDISPAFAGKTVCPPGTVSAPSNWDFGSGSSGGSICVPQCGHEGQLLINRTQCRCDEANHYFRATQSPTSYNDGSPRCISQISELVQECLEGGGEWNSTQDRCVCGPNFGQASSYDGEPLTNDNGSPKCLPRVAGIKLKVWTGNIGDAGTDAGFHLSIGRGTTAAWDSPEAMFFHPIANAEFEGYGGYDTLWWAINAAISIGDEGELELNRGDIETIILPSADSDVIVHEEGRSIESLLFCQDTTHLDIYPDPDHFDSADSWTESTIFGDAAGFDAWYITRIQMKVKLQGQSSYQIVFDDPAVNQWVEIPNSGYSYRWPINVIRRTIPCDEME